MLTTVTLISLASCSSGQSGDETTTTVPETTTSSETTVAEEAVVSETTTTVTATASGLAPVTILSVGPGGGSGEMTIVVDAKPNGWTRFKVSLDGPDSSSMRAKILDVQDTGDGVAIIVSTAEYTGGTPMTVAVSWVNDAEVTSALAYANCANGIPVSGSC